jgi:RimJ/RimL family protein N-acetyltransferase
MSSFLETERISLRTIGKADLVMLTALMSNREIGILSGEVYPITEKEMDDFFERTQKTEDRVWFVIEDKKTKEIIGETGFLRIFMPWRTSDYSLMIWNRNYWGIGYGKEISKEMLNYGFNYLNLHRIAIGVVENNKRAMKFWKSIGFIEEGKQKDGFFSEGRYSDFVMMYMLENDFRKRVNN